MKKNPLFVAVSNQKGGVGKSTMLVSLASLLNYSMDKSVAIVDCDSTQRSLSNLRERDKEMVEKNKKFMVLLEEQKLKGRKIYPYYEGKAEQCPPSGWRVGRKWELRHHLHRFTRLYGCARCIADHL